MTRLNHPADGYDALNETQQLRVASALLLAVIGGIAMAVVLALRYFDVLSLSAAAGLGILAFLAAAIGLSIYDGYGAMGDTIAAQAKRRTTSN